MHLPDILVRIIDEPSLHSKWLNTLSFMENAGAKKISACEHPEFVDIIVLKHAAEEHRHAYYLKKQISKIEGYACPTYTLVELIAPNQTRHYLNSLDIAACRYLKEVFQLTGAELKYAAYLFVTYAIEVRADVLYPIYQQALSEAQSRVTVKSIILEEEGHLEEMIAQLERFSEIWQKHADNIVYMEQKLFNEWIAGIAQEVLKD
ncbi:MAG: hypothetical protein EOO99_09570 [Pedobacter sp.]|nr:MAG: hypothetical protein EOO99_09570 [Pedobacter sp.]